MQLILQLLIWVHKYLLGIQEATTTIAVFHTTAAMHASPVPRHFSLLKDTLVTVDFLRQPGLVLPGALQRFALNLQKLEVYNVHVHCRRDFWTLSVACGQKLGFSSFVDSWDTMQSSSDHSRQLNSGQPTFFNI